MIGGFLSTIARPSNDPRPNPVWYGWAVNQLGHVIVGAALVTLVPWDLLSWLIAGLTYGAIKEIGDLTRGGGWRDGLVDTSFVTLGAFYAGPAWWPWAALGAVGVGALWRSRSGR